MWLPQGTICVTGPLREDELDDEARFWAWFFESLQPVRNAVVRAREAVYGSFLGGALETVGQLSDDVSDGVHAITQRAVELTYSGIQRSPGAAQGSPRAPPVQPQSLLRQPQSTPAQPQSGPSAAPELPSAFPEHPSTIYRHSHGFRATWPGHETRSKH